MALSENDRTALLNHINRAFNQLDRSSFQQEPAYVISLLARLLGKVDLDDGRYIQFKTSSTNDRGPGSAEKEFGADFGVVVIWSETNERKAILGQAKNKSAINKSEKSRSSIKNQCLKMFEITPNFVLMECPDGAGEEPQIFLAQNSGLGQTPVKLSTFIVDHLIGCLFGETDQNVASRIERSDLKHLVSISTNSPKPIPKNKKSPDRMKP